MFAVAQKLVARLRDRWSTVGPAVQLLIAAFIILISALAALWLVDKLLIYLVARSYVDDVATSLISTSISRRQSRSRFSLSQFI